MEEAPMAKKQSTFKKAKMIVGAKGGEKRMNRRSNANEGDYGVTSLDSVERHRIKQEYAEEVKAKKKQEKELKKLNSKKKGAKLFDAKNKKEAKGQAKVFDASVQEQPKSRHSTSQKIKSKKIEIDDAPEAEPVENKSIVEKSLTKNTDENSSVKSNQKSDNESVKQVATPP
jgi:hypothetical protein